VLSSEQLTRNHICICAAVPDFVTFHYPNCPAGGVSASFAINVGINDHPKSH
jgi:hypothetical protein